MTPRQSAAPWTTWLAALAACGDTASEPVASAPADRAGVSEQAVPREAPGARPEVDAPGVSAEDEAEAGGAVAAHPDDPDGWAPLVEFQGEPVDVVRVFRDDGTLERISCHLGAQRGPGSQHGPEWHLFPNGLSKLRQVWVHGELEGPFSVYWPIGLLRQEGTYRVGQRHGTFYQYFRTGDRHLEYQYEDGVPQGTWREWFVDGQPAAEENYLDGQRHGGCRKWTRPGQLDGEQLGAADEVILQEDVEYVEGVLHGAWADYWASTGELRRSGRMENDLKVGLWRASREDGTLKAEREFLAGVQEGAETLYDARGHRIAENHFSAGVQEGPQRSWYPEGQLQAEGAMRVGLREGPWKYYRPDGTLDEAWSGTYREGQRVGG